jgi:hypothetical protein
VVEDVFAVPMVSARSGLEGAPVILSVWMGADLGDPARGCPDPTILRDRSIETDGDDPFFRVMDDHRSKMLAHVDRQSVLGDLMLFDRDGGGLKLCR